MADFHDDYHTRFGRYLSGSKIILTTVFHPFDFAKTLIQMGHEPLPAVKTRSLFNKRPVMALPNVWTYAKHIHAVDGFSGCFRGLTPRICSSMLSTIVSAEVDEYMKDDKNKARNIEDQEPSQEKLLFHNLKKKLAECTITITITQPLHVITIRMMAQFIGGETKYSGIFGSLSTIYKEEGLAGLFAGFVPRLLGEISFIVLYETLFYGIKKLLPADLADERYQDQLTAFSLDFVIKSFLYPYHVLNVCMAVNNCGLVAGLPPTMPIYTSWYDCYRHLDGNKELKRGSSLILRYKPELDAKKA